ncbi:reverse transcriptase [Caerostris extrusa]|uniref:Reverse transcriptase n=1 Tax=Caerostris extrusa TaxID=172846 RepID=A0AAV4P1Z8_CAEEX|nr:reverse transcriptase [Caerostris extrusa]
MPYDLIFRDPVRTYSDTPSFATQLVNMLQTSFALVKQHLEKSAEEVSKYQIELPKSKQIVVGDLVYLDTPKIRIRTSKELAKLNYGPFRVIKQFFSVMFEIQHVNKQRVHLKRLVKVAVRQVFPDELRISRPLPPTTVIISNFNFVFDMTGKSNRWRFELRGRTFLQTCDVDVG